MATIIEILGYEMITLFEDDYLKIALLEVDAPHTTLCFSSIGHPVHGVELQSEEFIKSSQAATSIFIVDKQRSWGNYVDFPKLNQIIQPYLVGKTVNALGNSMGGFLAILASKFIDISVVVAIVPQYSISKEIIPQEHRWGRYVDGIKDWKYLSLKDSFCDSTQYYILSGIGGNDDKQVQFFPTQKNVKKMYFKDKRFDHKVAQCLKEDGILYDVIFECFSFSRPQAIYDKYFKGRNYAIRYELPAIVRARTEERLKHCAVARP